MTDAQEILLTEETTLLDIRNWDNLDTALHLDTWLHHYNTERPHLGYRNQGRRPIETINLFVSQEG